MAVSYGLEKCIQYTALDPKIGVGENSHLRRDLIGHLEAHAGDVVGQLVGVLADDAVHGRAVLIVDLHGQI